MTNINKSVLMMFEDNIEAEEKPSKLKSYISRNKGRLALGLVLGLAANRKK